MSPQAVAEATRLWLPLLRELSDAAPEWAVWKNADDALNGAGDVDCMAPRRHWDDVEHRFLRWARAHGLGPVVVCRHAPGALFLVALDPSDGPWLQLDVRSVATLRGAPVCDAEDVAGLAIADERGFRRLAPGAEGALKLVISGIAPGGRPNLRGLRKERVGELLRADPSGVRRAARLFGPAEGALLAGAEAAAAGSWNRRAMALVEGSVMLRVLRRPTSPMAQLGMRRAKRRCPVLVTGIRHGRTIPGARAEWLRTVAETHIVHGRDPARG